MDYPRHHGRAGEVVIDRVERSVERVVDAVKQRGPFNDR
jgi:hypothetical protein